MRTTLYVNRKLLKEAMRLANVKKMTETVNLALAEFVYRRKMEELASRLGTLELNLTQAGLEQLRRDE
ncbi:type II toxin-antitoxin system VapB family antitoxin [Moorella sp. Hama-1]|uniref:type II toxin-antitoxin system VapB family antitoxin n=1 Tax=Moorella sp. Hama-1 TaxID=2138101 RepID=UPI000D64E381|nr:type II toxin-antitoxin system VapB family antitoxin [Moorella sp. Hama-1]BCV22032.1 hypothetical protein hamaS1_21010 [Moorella sp. Hama-1]